MTKNPLLLLILLATLLTGCSTTLYTSTNDELSYEATDVEKIGITTNDNCEVKFQEIGYVSTVRSSLISARNAILRKAAKMGGDKILEFKVTVVRSYMYILFIPVPVDHYACRGIVIKYI